MIVQITICHVPVINFSFSHTVYCTLLTTTVAYCEWNMVTITYDMGTYIIYILYEIYRNILLLQYNINDGIFP